MNERNKKKKKIQKRKISKHTFEKNAEKWKEIKKKLKKADKERREKKEIYEIIVYKDSLITKLREKNILLMQTLERMSKDYEDLKRAYEDEQ